MVDEKLRKRQNYGQDVKYSVAALMLTGCTIESISEKLGISEKTIDNWLKTPKFRQILIDAGSRVMDATIIDLISQTKRCNEVLREILDGTNDKNRLAAIKIIFASSQRWLEADLLRRIESLEAIVNDSNSLENTQFSDDLKTIDLEDYDYDN